MKYILRMAKVDTPGQLVFDDMRQAVNAACVAIMRDAGHPEEILSEDGRIVMTHEEISAEWARRVRTGKAAPPPLRG
jgi:hypothetical protein